MCKGPGVGRSCQFKKLDKGQNRGEKVPGEDVGHVRQVLGGGCEGLVCFLRTGGGFGMVFKRDWWGHTAKGTGGAVSRLRRSEGTLSRPGCHGQTVAQAAHCTGAPRHAAGFVRGAASSLCPAGEAGLGLPGGRVIFFYFPSGFWRHGPACGHLGGQTDGTWRGFDACGGGRAAGWSGLTWGGAAAHH